MFVQNLDQLLLRTENIGSSLVVDGRVIIHGEGSSEDCAGVVRGVFAADQRMTWKMGTSIDYSSSQWWQYYSQSVTDTNIF